MAMEQIKQYIEKIEREKNVQVLYACETGSRAWGFPSPDSDYDVRFIYKHDIDWYLSLNQRRDSLEFPLRDAFDVTGWDIRKSLVLLKKSNAALIERFQSPIVYVSNKAFADGFNALIEQYYSPLAVFYHHFSLAWKFREEMKDMEEVKLKKYFYFIRSLLSCNWILERSEVVPMHLEGLMTLIGKDEAETIRALVKLKSGENESYVYHKNNALDKWLEELWKYVESQKERPLPNRSDYTMLNQFFKKTLYGAFDNRLGEEQ